MNSETPKQENGEGGIVSKDGKELSDNHFHELAWNTTPENAKADLEAIVKEEVELAEQQAEAFSRRNPDLGISAFKGLLSIYPGHPNSEKWKEKIDEIKKSVSSK